VDAWFFRDGKPSNRGENQADLQSLFPPHATTVVGALRAALARSQGWSGRGGWSETLTQTLGDGFDDLGELSFVGPFLLRRDKRRDQDTQPQPEPLLPMPRHVLGQTKHADDQPPTFEPRGWLSPTPEPVVCDAGDQGVRLPEPPPPSDPSAKPLSPAEGFLVSVEGMQAILKGELPDSAQCVSIKQLFRHEPRIGIEREPQTMYSPSYVRLSPGVSLAMGIRGLPGGWSAPGLMPLGGESRLAGCQALPEPLSLPKSPDRISEGAPPHCFTLTLLSPAEFDPERWWGAGPGDPASDLHPDLPGNVVTATFDRPVRIGGWDGRAKGGPLPMRPLAPAGSVWWIESSDPVTASLAEPFHLGRSTAYGQGLALIGRCPMNPHEESQP